MTDIKKLEDLYLSIRSATWFHPAGTDYETLVKRLASSQADNANKDRQIEALWFLVRELRAANQGLQAQMENAQEPS